jgi:hypothetical protein
MFKHFPGMDGVYHRWYQRWSEGFRWDASATGLTGLGPRYGSPQFYPFVAGETGQLAIQAQVIAESDWGVRNFTQNEGEPVAFDPQRWYCVEVFVKLNTPGLADGELAAWIDGELKLRYTGRAFRGLDPADPAPPTARIESASIAGQYGATSDVPQLQFSWHDDHVVSSDRIGCAPAGLPPLPTEPSPP